MGQVPETLHGIVGDGRLARHLRHYFDLLDIPYRIWSRREGAQAEVTAPEALSSCRHILVALSDSAIEPWIREFRALAPDASHTFVHFSGSLSTPLATGMHPLTTFGHELHAQAFYERVPFAVELAPGSVSFREVFPELPNPHHVIRPEDKAFYHALCVMSGNFTTLLWQKMFRTMEERLGLPKAAAHPYLRQIAQNLVASPDTALTGPIARGDHETLARDLMALEGDRFEPIFRAFVETFSGAGAGAGVAQGANAPERGLS